MVDDLFEFTSLSALVNRSHSLYTESSVISVKISFSEYIQRLTCGAMSQLESEKLSQSDGAPSFGFMAWGTHFPGRTGKSTGLFLMGPKNENR